MTEPRVRRTSALIASSAAACVLFAGTAARAGDLTLFTREHGSWNDSLAALRDDLRSQGTTIHVGVRSEGEAAGCDRYRLELDEAAKVAFRVGRCDPGTGETPVVLWDRGALFDDSHVPRPRTISISAVLRTTAVGSGVVQGGSLVRCSWTVRPYLDDARSGTRVVLTPEHYDLRSATASVSTTADRTGWTLGAQRPSGTAAFELEYTVSDRATGDVVLRQKTTLTCGAEGAPVDPAPQAPAPQAAPVVIGAPPVPGEQVVIYQPPPPVAPECMWGRGHNGCKDDPLGWATVSGVLAIGFTGASVGLISTGFARNSDLPKLVGGLMAFPALATTTVFAIGMHAHNHPQGLAAVSPAVAFTGKGASFGVNLAF